MTRSFDVFFDLRLNKRLSKQWWGWWFDTLSHPLWRHRNALYIDSLRHSNINVSALEQYCFRLWLVASATPAQAPSYYTNQWWLIVMWALGNKHQWYMNQSAKIEQALENTLYKWRLFCSRLNVSSIHQPSSIKTSTAAPFANMV